ncbi:4881_t:CDS:1, partial [Dentiscutata erythropus]
NYQLHREQIEVEIKAQLWNSNIERIQKFVFEYLEDQKIFKNSFNVKLLQFD